MQKLILLSNVFFKLKNKDIKTKKYWGLIRSFFKKPKKKKVVKKKKLFFLSQFFFSLFSFLVPRFSFRGNSGFSFKFFSKLFLYSKSFLSFDLNIVLFEFLSKLLLPFDFRQKKKSGKALFLPMLINMQSQYYLLFRLFFWLLFWEDIGTWDMGCTDLPNTTFFNSFSDSSFISASSNLETIYIFYLIGTLFFSSCAFWLFVSASFGFVLRIWFTLND